MNYSRQYESVAAPPADVIRQRLRRRQVKLATVAASAAAIVAVGAVAAAASVLPAARHHGPSDKTHPAGKSPLGWLPAGPELTANAKPEAAPYVVSLGKGRLRGWSLTVINWQTGAVLGHVRRPGGRCFGEVIGAADDRTFLLTANSCGVPVKTYVYELKLSASGRPEPLIPIGLPKFRPPNTTFALSPDGTYLAYASVAVKPHKLPNRSVITLYDLMTGTRRSWYGPGIVSSVAWAGDHTLVFGVFWNNHQTKPPIAMGVRLLSISVRGTSYVASRVLTGPSNNGNPLPAGRNVLYDTPEIMFGGSPSAEIARFSARTGEREFTFKPWLLIGRNYFWCDPMWADGSGRHALAACGAQSSVHYLRIDGNRMRRIDLHVPLQYINPAMNVYYFAF